LIEPRLCFRGCWPSVWISFGIDFTILYPNAGLGFPHQPNAEMRRALCRALNQHNDEYFGEFSDRMTPAAVIPMHTPEEAIEELEHAVKVLGLKVAMFPTYVSRPKPGPGEGPSGSRLKAGFDGLLRQLDSDLRLRPGCGRNASN